MDIFTSDIDTSLTQIECMAYVALKDSIKDILDKHAVEREISVKPRKPAPWITPAVKAAKQKQRQAERQWRKLRTQAGAGVGLTAMLFTWYNKQTAPEPQTSAIPEHNRGKSLASVAGYPSSCRELV
ncbi:hypothetical protein ElyMa_000338400 [Elysia marginata]|uniref:Uncharacterized protein n=1 Tax=Elysia marginata TaxID=1093978 RepID=A0AAV4FES0_9GAST|nr:hypothetical protein ElyMa_000338400 [Elysia marginata]